MNRNVIFAVLLIAIGVTTFAYQGITYKTREKAVDLGSVQITTEKTRNIPLPPVVGAVALIAGVVLLFRNSKV